MNNKEIWLPIIAVAACFAIAYGLILLRMEIEYRRCWRKWPFREQ